jgi:hypothetical protein
MTMQDAMLRAQSFGLKKESRLDTRWIRVVCKEITLALHVVEGQGQNRAPCDLDSYTWSTFKSLLLARCALLSANSA